MLTTITAALALVSLGGGLYGYRVIDPAWPGRPDLIQPECGGVSRRRFWIPAHVAFEISLIVALVVTWSESTIRIWLLLGFARLGANLGEFFPSLLVSLLAKSIESDPLGIRFRYTLPRALGRAYARRDPRGDE